MALFTGYIRKIKLVYVLLYVAGGLSFLAVNLFLFGRDKQRVKPLADSAPDHSLSSVHREKGDPEEFIHANPVVNMDLCVNQSFSYSPEDSGIKKKNIFYCNIPKVASTFTTALINKMPKCHQDGYCFDRTSLRRRFKPSQSSFSFMWVREPYSRLFSAFENKLFTPNGLWQRLGRKIILRTRKRPSKKSASLGHDVTFVELVRDVVELTLAESEINEHLRPMHEICDPCKIKYDFIGKLENFTTAVGHVCDALRRIDILDEAKSSCNDIVSEGFSRVRTLFDILTIYSEDLDIDLSPKDKLTSMDRTWRSFQIRGVLSKNLKLPFSVKNVGKVTFAKYCQALNESLAASRNKTELKSQRQQALLQAYMSVPLEDMEQLKNFVRRDCELFGYDLEPQHLFQSRDLEYDGFDYFGGLLS